MAATDTPLAGKVALTFFFNLMEKSGCSEDEQKVLLGGIGNDAYHKYKSSPEYACVTILWRGFPT